MTDATAPDLVEQLSIKALDRMKTLGIPPSPNNFTVWYHYHSGQFPELTRTIDVLADNDQTFDEDTNDDLFQKFFTFGVEGVVLSETSSRLERELSKVIEYLSESRSGAAAYGETLQAVSGDMGGGDDRLKSLIDSVVTATRVMERQNHTLEEQLKESSEEVTRLREDLEDLRREATTDALTGIANRKVFDTTLRREAMTAMEEGKPLSLLMLDIDHFKGFNDTFGHQVGDQVLKLLAHTLTNAIKGQDTAARYGGEEFAVILPGTALDGALAVAEHIRDSVATRKVVNRTTGKDLGQITVSVGVAGLEYGEPIGQFINRADQALYEAKNRGRNRVVSEAAVKEKELSFEH